MKLDSTLAEFHSIPNHHGLEHLCEVTVNSEEGLRLALETGNIGLWVWNVSDPTTPKQFSRRLYEILGLSPDTIVTQASFLECVHPDDRVRVDLSVRAALSGHSAGRYREQYCIVRRNDGATRCLVANGQAFFTATGEAYRFIGTVMDTTEQKLAEETLAQQNEKLEERIRRRTGDLARANQALEQALGRMRTSEAELRALVDVIPTQVWFASGRGGILFQNRQWLDYTGMTEETAGNWGWQEALHPEDREAYSRRWEEIQASRAPGEAEARFRRHDGHYRWFLMRVVPVFDERGEILRWYGTNTDIEDRRSSEQVARGHLEAITRTLGALTHEADSDRLLEHVMGMITVRLQAHSVAYYERLEPFGFALRATFEGGRLSTSGATDDVIPTSSLLPPGHPLWNELHADRDRCLMGELDPPRIRLADDPDARWYSAPENYVPSGNLRRLVVDGVVGVLIVPMKVGGELTGLLSIRSRNTSLFQPSERMLGQALAYQAMLAVQLMRLSRETRLTAALNERERMARNLHDTLAQGFTGVIVQLEAAEDARQQGLGTEADEHVTRASELARESLREARRSIRSLRPQALEENNLCDALRGLLDKMTAGTPTRTTLHLHGQPRELDEELEENLLRISQEVLTNSLRHAAARHFEVALTFGDEAVDIHLRDDGRGFDIHAPCEGFGLVGIRERAELLGGHLDLESTPGNGTSVSISFPCPR